MLSYKKVMLALASCILVTSCNKNEEDVPVQNQENVSFTASMKTLSRATETNFEENEENYSIPVYFIDNYHYYNYNLSLKYFQFPFLRVLY